MNLRNMQDLEEEKISTRMRNLESKGKGEGVFILVLWVSGCLFRQNPPFLFPRFPLRLVVTLTRHKSIDCIMKNSERFLGLLLQNSHLPKLGPTPSQPDARVPRQGKALPFRSVSVSTKLGNSHIRRQQGCILCSWLSVRRIPKLE